MFLAILILGDCSKNFLTNLNFINMSIVSLASVDAQNFQQSNPGGVRNVYAIISRQITGVWPNEDIIDANGLITELPTLVTGAKWSQYLTPDGTAEFSFDGGGDPSYQSYKHMIELALAGSSSAVRKEVKKFLNAGGVFLIEDKSGNFVVLGNSDDPIYIKSTFKSGKKGNDKRGYTLKGEVDGMMWEQVFLTPALVADLEFNALP